MTYSFAEIDERREEAGPLLEVVDNYAGFWFSGGTNSAWGGFGGLLGRGGDIAAHGSGSSGKSIHD